MKAGNLRHYITIEEPIEIQDSNRELILTWSIFATVWAEIMPLAGREYWSSKQINSETTGKIRIRYLPGITPKMRIRFGARAFNITGVVNIEERNKEIIIYYSEV